MDMATHAGLPVPNSGGLRPEPRWMTLADLGVIVAGAALVLTIPSRASGWPPFFPPPPLLFMALIGGLRLTMGFGLVLSLVVLFRHGRYGGTVRPAEWLALGFASLCLLDVVPNLDEAVNAYYAAVGSTALDFGVARWLSAAPAAAGVVLAVAAVLLLRSRVRDGSRVASALTVVAIVGGLSLWFWGPCEIARLQLPWLLVPSPRGDPASWGWRGPVVLALREIVANSPVGLTWGIPAAASVRAWRNDARGGHARSWVWTERAALAAAVAVAAALLLLTPFRTQGPAEIVQQVSWAVGVGLLSWWIAGRYDCSRVFPHHRRNGL